MLEQLHQKNPSFYLYQQKIEECRASMNSVEEVSGNPTSFIPEKDYPNYEPSFLLELAIQEFRQGFFSECMSKCRYLIDIDHDAYRVYLLAERASIVTENYEDANMFFLSRPASKIPETLKSQKSNPVLPNEFVLPKIKGPGNDYGFIEELRDEFIQSGEPFNKSVSVIIPVYNRHQVLANTLAALTHQTYPAHLIEVIVVDDGSSDDIYSIIRKYETRLNLYYARQKDKGYRLSKVRNIGIRMATNDCIIVMDADILSLPEDIARFMEFHHVSDAAVLLGHRRYVDTSSIDDEMILRDIKTAIELPGINPSNSVSDCRNNNGESIDWRLPLYEKTDFLKKDRFPFTKISGCSISFPESLLEKTGYFDEEFEAWGCEDGEFGYRAYNAGYYFIPIPEIMALHQEPVPTDDHPSMPLELDFRQLGLQETKAIYSRKCPVPGIRTYDEFDTFDIPKVSIYIPAYNTQKYIKEAVESCLNQTMLDLEVCICNDGSTDDTLRILEENFASNPRVRWKTQENQGIASASTTAIEMCRGMYIGHLDSDDLLKPDAVALCVKVLDNSDADAVYTDSELIDQSGRYVRDGWCSGEFSREGLLTSMTVSPFRMFRKRIWSRTEGFNQSLENAVDFDFWLKINEKGTIQHIHKVLYSYRWHSHNTSIRNRKLQERNHIRAANLCLKRLGLFPFWEFESAGNVLNPRDLRLKQKNTVLKRDVACTTSHAKRGDLG